MLTSKTGSKRRQRPDPDGFGLFSCREFGLACPSAAYEVHDDGDQCEEQQKVDEEAADMEEEKSAQPKQH